MPLRKDVALDPDKLPAQRVRFDGTEYKNDGATQWIEVCLSYGDRDAVGRSESVASEGEINDLFATVQATIHAIGELTGDVLDCELTDCDIVRAFRDEFIVVLIALKFQGRDIRVFGKCREREELADAAACATLDALNQHITLALENPQ